MRKLELRAVPNDLYEVEQLSAERRTITVGDGKVTVFAFKSWELREMDIVRLKEHLHSKIDGEVLVICMEPDAEFEIYELDPPSSAAT